MPTTTTPAPQRAGTTGALWTAMAPVHDEILRHPFLAGLTDGSLPREVFLGYVVQDAHYLREYARALSLCSARASAEAEILMFAQHAAGAIEVERALHAGFFADAGLDEASVAATPMSPTCTAYTSYLLAVTATGSYAEAVAAVLPCYWIYAEVGVALLEAGSPDPLYQRWIDTYGGEEFGAIVAAVLDVTDAIGAAASAREVEAMRRHAVTTSRYEWMFWDAAWRRERWPVHPEPEPRG